MFVDHVCWVGVSEDLQLTAQDFLLFGGFVGEGQEAQTEKIEIRRRSFENNAYR